jgi:hypothetical protein
VALFDLLGGALFRLDLKELRLLTALALITHLEPPLLGYIPCLRLSSF